MKRKSYVPWLLLMAFALAVMSGGCGGSSGDGGGRYLRGQFVDGPVQGLTYTSSAGTAVTDRDGYFEYREGDDIVFKVGNIALPPVKGAEIILPMNYYSGADENDVDHPGVVQFVRFMMSAAGVKEGDDLGPELRLAIPEANQVFGGREATWDTNGVLFGALETENLITVSPAAAREHISQSVNNLRDRYVGIYSGTWRGTSYGERGNGTWRITIVDGGSVSGSYAGDDYGSVSGRISVFGETSMVGGEAGGYVTWTGKIDLATGRMDGTFSGFMTSGTFTGRKE